MTLLSPRSVSAAMRRKSATSEIRPTILCMRLSSVSISRQNALNYSCGGFAFNERHCDDTPSPAFDFSTANDAVVNPIRTLNENIGAYLQNGLKRSVFVEHTHPVDHLQTSQNFRALGLIEDRPGGTFNLRIDSSLLIATTRTSPKARER